ncbi:MAG: diacylglycerol kinase [Myxococcaceae bacterium]|nr:diacylglycerol kinase [Myxococcaceae bacterium]
MDAHRTTVGHGRRIAALFNGRAKQVTPGVVRALTDALPEAQVFVSDDLLQAERHAKLIAGSDAEVVLSGGGDGAAMRLIRMLRAQIGSARAHPALGILKLGTGNAWAHTTGACGYRRLFQLLPRMPWPLPLRRFDLVTVEGWEAPFAGVGWDALILNNYQRNLDKRSSQIFGSRLATRLHKGLGGYLYSAVRYTVPKEWRLTHEHGAARVTLEVPSNEPLYTVDPHGIVVQLAWRSPLYEGPVSVGAAATIPEYGYGLRAFPFATRLPGFINLRVYDRAVLEALGNLPRIWRGDHPVPGMHDFFVKRARMRFSRPMPFQIGGDASGQRTEVEYGVAKEPVNCVDWEAALAEARR